MEIPISTYRLQLSSKMTLEQVKELIPYFEALGIQTLYFSPLQMAAPGSQHGYDVVDHTRINPEIGDEATLSELSQKLNILLDIVPNHMCITSPLNAWWQEVLKKGQQAKEAAYFDIDWQEGKVLQPFLGESFEEAKQNGNLECKDGVIHYGGMEFPSQQTYRLTHWKEGCDHCNYRRFFNVSELACLRMENPEVFQKVHALIFHWIENGWVQGLRIDHIDGLKDPASYLRNLQECTGGIYVVVEKILEKDEALPRTWECQGTTGYEFLNQLQGLYIKDTLDAVYRNFTGITESFEEIVVQSKAHVLKTSMASEWNQLKAKVPDNLHLPLFDLLTHFPVYRTYNKELKSHGDPKLLEWINSHPDFLSRLQQVTGPVMAKGYEDTALYRYFPQAALNEVGSSLQITSLDAFHQKMIDRQKQTPYALSATTTHDTKRSEDVRARIACLSEISDEWKAAIDAFHKQLNCPDKNLEYLFYQTLVGTWPLEPLTRQEHKMYVDRIVNYMIKAAKEAGQRTSWIDEDASFENELATFVQMALSENPSFVHAFEAFVRPLIRPGLLTALSSLAVKMTAPGVPDLYQGSEMWTTLLVDPDNRRPVNYVKRNALFQSRRSLSEKMQNLYDGEIKFFLTQKCLELRKKNSDLFLEGSYEPLNLQDTIAFKRERKKQSCITISGRFFMQNTPFGTIELEKTYTDIFTGRMYSGKTDLYDILNPLPCSVLVSA